MKLKGIPAEREQDIPKVSNSPTDSTGKQIPPSVQPYTALGDKRGEKERRKKEGWSSSERWCVLPRRCDTLALCAKERQKRRLEVLLNRITLHILLFCESNHDELPGTFDRLLLESP